MTDLDMNAPATLKWVRKDVAHERRLASVREAVRVAMKELTRADFFSARVIVADEVLAGDEIVEVFRTGKLRPARYAGF